MRQTVTKSIVRSAAACAIVCAALATTARVAQAQSRFYFGPEGFGYGYEDDNVGVIIGRTPYDRHDDDHQHEYDDDRYYDEEDYQEDYYQEEEAYEEPETPAAVIDAEGEAAEFQALAEEAFRAGDYRTAARWSRHAMVEDPQNGALHLFAGQIYFATGDFAPAAAAVQRGMSLSERDDWGLVVKNYAQFYEDNHYVDQMSALVAFIKKHPDAPYAYFLRGYHYGFLGHEKAARADFAKALELESRDRLAGELLVMMGGQLPAKPAVAAPKPAADAAAAVEKKAAE